MKGVEYPRLVAIETTNRCNASCRFCPNSGLRREGGVMEGDLFEKILQDCRAFPLVAMEPFLQGEPFLDPHILSRIERIHQVLPSTKVRLYTNGQALTPSLIGDLAKLRLSRLYFSLNSTRPETYRFLTGQDLAVAKGNLYALAEARRRAIHPFELVVRMTVTEACTVQERLELVLLCAKLGARPMFARLFNYKGDIHSPLPVPVYPCEHISRLDILVDGRVTLCCMDQEGEYSWGDVRDQSVLDVFWSSRAQHYRTMLRSGKRSQCEPCSRCNVYWPDLSHVSPLQKAYFTGHVAWYYLRHQPFL